jgi:hypothetical protein
MFYSHAELADYWGVSQAQLRRWFIQGDLAAYVWLPLMSVFKRSESGIKTELCHWEGYASISRHYCFRLFRGGSVRLREFSCRESGELHALPESADDLIIQMDDLVVLEDDVHGFKGGKACGALASEAAFEKDSADECYVADSSFKIISHKGMVYRFGNMQAAILCALYEGAQVGKPWQSGKRLLQQAGSQSFSLSNVFKRNPIWRELILSDGRGAYKMDTRRIVISSQ